MGKRINAPAFLLAENPMTEKQLFVIHTGNPYVMAEVFIFHSSLEYEIMNCQREFNVGSKTTYGNITAVMGAIMVIPDEKFVKLNAQEQADKLARLMRRMADWYYAILKWELSDDKA